MFLLDRYFCQVYILKPHQQKNYKWYSPEVNIMSKAKIMHKSISKHIEMNDKFFMKGWKVRDGYLSLNWDAFNKKISALAEFTQYQMGKI